jgi:hypothetical protein
MVSAREVWGPLVWKLFHRLADISDRRDIYLLWNTWLRKTHQILPCDLCRKHMREYWIHHSFVPKSWASMTGEKVRTTIRDRLHLFHNDVNERLGKPVHPLHTEIPLDRNAVLSECRDLVKQIRVEWSDLSGPLVAEWYHAVQMLILLLEGGSQI